MNDFMNAYRYTDGSYKCQATDIESLEDAVLLQKRINVTYLASLMLSKGITNFDTVTLEGDMQESTKKDYADFVYAFKTLLVF